jgi:phosphoenolpyruvate---glycerone phosphotransferase subunit DhaM
VVGIVIVSHSRDIAAGTAALAGQMAGEEVRIEAAGGAPDGGLGTDSTLVEAAIAAAEQGDGLIVLGDLGSAILTVRAVLEELGANGSVRLVDAPLVEGAVAAAVVSSAGRPLGEVAAAAEEARAIPKL